MNSILASIFSPRKASQDRELASSPLRPGPKSALSTKKLRRKSLPEQKDERSVRFQEILNEADVPPTPTKSPKKKSPDRKNTQKMSPATKSPRRSDVAGEDEYTFTRFTDYRWDGNSIEIEVEWEQGDVTWEPEAQLHQDAPDALLEYWESQGGRPTNPNDPDLFDIHAIRKHSKDRKKLLVEWVGYGPKEATWVSRTVVEETAPEVVAQYWKTVKPVQPKRQRRRRG